MILTLTANPSLDHTLVLDRPLTAGALLRAERSTTEPGGKGVNVARVLHGSGCEALAVLPCPPQDRIRGELDAIGVRYRAVDSPHPTRTNVTVSEPEGRRTKINDPGPPLPDVTVREIRDALVELVEPGCWVTLCGSLPPGVTPAWYADLVTHLHVLGARVAVDTTDDALAGLAAGFPHSAPDVLKPNPLALGRLTGTNPDRLRRAALAGDPIPAAKAANELVRRGVGAVLATLGRAGAVLATPEGLWHGSPPPITVASTVGAGDAALAGYLIADVSGHDAADRLRQAVAYGTAAAGLPGTSLPRRTDAHPDGVVITELTPAETP